MVFSRRKSMIGTLTAPLLGACFCIALTLHPAVAQEPTPDTAALEAELAAFEQETAEFQQETFAIHEALLEKTPPSLQDPVYAGHVAKALDNSLLEKMKEKRFLAGVCHRAGAVQAAYLLRGIKKDKFDPFAIQNRLRWDADAATLKLKDQNYLRFQDELVQVLRFGLICRTFQLEKLNTYLQQMPQAELNVFRTGFPDFQQGLAELVTYHASALRQPIRPENRQAVIDLLVQYSDKLAAGMSKESRKIAAASIGRALAAPGTSPDDVKKLGKIRQALSRTDCGKVCAFR